MQSNRIAASTLFALTIVGCQTPADRTDTAAGQIDEREPIGSVYHDSRNDARDDKKIVRTRERRVDTDKNDKQQYERFEAYKDETKDQFVRRASSSLANVEDDLRKLTREVDARDEAEQVAHAMESVMEAHRDIAEVQAGGKTFDDGKLGVTVAINQAQRNVSDLRRQLGG